MALAHRRDFSCLRAVTGPQCRACVPSLLEALGAFYGHVVRVRLRWRLSITML